MKDIDLDTLLVMIYVFVDEWYQEHIAGMRSKRGRPAECSDSEILTLAIVSEWRCGVSWQSERGFLRYMHKHYASWFPSLPKRSGFNRPLFITLMLSIYVANDGLPTRRGELYHESILLLLDKWTRERAGEQTLHDILGTKTKTELLAQLANLAYAVQNETQNEHDTPEVNYGNLTNHLIPLGNKQAYELIPYLSEKAGVVVSPGDNDGVPIFHFAHRTFQEYLAARKLVADCDQSYRLIRQHIMRNEGLWRLPCILVADVLCIDSERELDAQNNLWKLISDLLQRDNNDLDEAHHWAVWLAATIASEQQLLGDTDDFIEQSVLNKLQKELVELIEAGGLRPVEWALCGRVLAQLGDPRKGVGVIKTGKYAGVPDVEWVHVPAGKFTYR